MEYIRPNDTTSSSFIKINRNFNELLNSIKKSKKEIKENNERKLNLSDATSTLVLFADWLQYNGKWSLPEQQVKDFLKDQQKQI
jgi:hypothetical protein